MRFSLYRLLPFALGIMLLIGACRSVKLGNGEYTLSRIRIHLDSTAQGNGLNEGELLPYLGQKAGRSQVHNHSEAEYGLTSLLSALYNQGYLDAEVRMSVDTLKHRRVQLNYHIFPGRLYLISNSTCQIKDPVIDNLLHPTDTLLQKRNFPEERYRTFLDSGQRLSPNLMQEERKRITRILRNRGHWQFREEQIHFEVDTSRLHSDAWIKTVIDTTSTVYTVAKINVHQTGSDGELSDVKREQFGRIAYLLGGRNVIRPKTLGRKVWIKPGDLYSQDMVSRTYSALSDIPAIRSVNITSRIDSTSSTPAIAVDIQTQAERSKELVADVVGTNSGGNLGAIVTLAFQHNNVFGGAEQLRLSSNVGYEELRTGSSDHLSYGFEATLRFPGLLIPFRDNNRLRNIKGVTDLSLSYSYLSRPEFKRDLFSSSWNYNWMHYYRPSLRYVIKPLEIDYMYFGYMDPVFLASVPNYDRMLNYRNQLVVSSSFTLSYNSARENRYAGRQAVHNLRLYVQTAGNILYGVSKLLNAPQDEYGAYTFQKANIVQFIKGELDYSGLYKLGEKDALAYRASISAVVPYGNNTFLPIDFRYFSGGASSLRGWSARGLGPGSMSRSVGTSIFHQVGDIKLDLSTELRLRVARSWELAVFLDAGNIWTIRKYDEQPGGDFNISRFWQEIALNSGLGVRWDFDYFLLRLDAGLKLYDPQSDRGGRWVIGHQRFKDLWGIHFALGYPF